MPWNSVASISRREPAHPAFVAAEYPERGRRHNEIIRFNWWVTCAKSDKVSGQDGNALRLITLKSKAATGVRPRLAEWLRLVGSIRRELLAAVEHHLEGLRWPPQIAAAFPEPDNGLPPPKDPVSRR